MIITGKKFSKPEMSRVKNGDIVMPEKRIVEKERLDQILVKMHPEYNRSTLQNFIKSGYVMVNDKVIKKPNTEIVKSVTDNGKKEMCPLKIKLNVPEKKELKLHKRDILYEDDNVLIINKPAGLLQDNF